MINLNYAPPKARLNNAENKLYFQQKKLAFIAEKFSKILV